MRLDTSSSDRLSRIGSAVFSSDATGAGDACEVEVVGLDVLLRTFYSAVKTAPSGRVGRETTRRKKAGELLFVFAWAPASVRAALRAHEESGLTVIAVLYVPQLEEPLRLRVVVVSLGDERSIYDPTDPAEGFEVGVLSYGEDEDD